MARSTFVYVSYIRTTPEKLWTALTDPVFIKQYWFGMTCESRFETGSPWRLVSESGELYDEGEIVEAVPAQRLVIRWRHRRMPELEAEGDSLCTMAIEPDGGGVKLTITHTVERPESKLIHAVSGGWPKVVSNLKSLLETGAAVINESCGAT